MIGLGLWHRAHRPLREVPHHTIDTQHQVAALHLILNNLLSDRISRPTRISLQLYLEQPVMQARYRVENRIIPWVS